MEDFFCFSAFDPTDMLRRTDSKESNCSSMTNMSHREDLRQTLSVPASAFVSLFLSVGISSLNGAKHSP